MEKRPILLNYLERMSDCMFRCLLRNTDNYAKLLQQAYSVRVLRSPEAEKQLADAALRDMSGSPEAEECRQNAVVAACELESLAKGDIPMFLSRGDSCDLFAGDKVIVREFDACPVKN